MDRQQPTMLPQPDEHDLEYFSQQLENSRRCSLLAGKQLITLQKQFGAEFYRSLIGKVTHVTVFPQLGLPQLTPEELRQLVVLAMYGASRYDVAVKRGMIDQLEHDSKNGGPHLSLRDMAGR